MKIAEVRELNDEQLSQCLKNSITTYFQLRVKSAMDRLETPSEVLKERRKIARIYTIQREKIQRGKF